MSKPQRPTRLTDAPRSGRARSAGDILGKVGDPAFRRFGFVQGAVVSRWGEIVGERYAKVSSPESIRFPTGRKSGGVLSLLVEGAHAPLMQHLTPLIIERVNRFFGYAAVDRLVFRQGRQPAPPPQHPSRPALSAVPKELGEGLRQIVDPELRACLEALAARLESSEGPPSINKPEVAPVPVIIRSE
ncbi:MAG: DciA family protein [Sphingomicrobium sp.]